MKEWFLARGYSEIIVNNQIDKVVYGRDQSVKKTLESGISFVATYKPQVKELGKLIRDLLLFLYCDEVGYLISSYDILQKCYRSKR